MANDNEKPLVDAAVFYVKAVAGGIGVLVAARIIEYGARLVLGFV